MDEQTDIRDFLEEVQNSRELFGTDHKARMAHCLRHFAAKKIPLLTCCDARHLNRSLSTLQEYCRELGLRFPDYVPMALRTEEERKRKKAHA